MASMVLPSLSSLVSNPTPKRTPSTPLQELFDMVDSDGSGGISPEEFVTLMVEGGIGESFQCDERGAKELFRILEVDRDGNGVLDEEEFALCVKKIAKLEGKEENAMISEFIDALKDE